MTLKLTPLVEGNQDGETLVFVQGWPDDASLWDDAVAALRDRYRCVRVTLPNFAGERAARWGYRTEEIVDALVAFIREAGRGRKVTLILHDWGCYWGHAAHHRAPELVARVAGLDIAPHFKPSAGAAAGMLAYQGWLFAAFVGGGRIGDWMTRSLARAMKAPRAPRVDSWMNYPYLYIWADLFSGRAQRLTKGYYPTCPLLFVYGKNKPFPFHSDAWLDHVRRAGGEVVELPCGHWVMQDPAFIPLLERWLSTTEGAARG